MTAAVGVLLIVPIAAELVTIPLGVHHFMSVHVFVGFVLVPLLLLKLASTGWRFTRYYTRSAAYRAQGAPQPAMRLLAPLFVAATVVLFSSGVAMGILHGHALVVARRLHGPVSVIWIVLVAIHVLVYFKRSLSSGTEDVIRAKRGSVHGVGMRAFALTAAALCGLAIAAATVPEQRQWIDLPHDHHGDRSVKR